MSRVQLALNVTDVDAAVEFYSKLFATPVAKRKPGSKADRAASEAGDYHPNDEVTADRAKQAGANQEAQQ